jgi:outer membrane protein TolC
MLKTTLFGLLYLVLVSSTTIAQQSDKTFKPALTNSSVVATGNGKKPDTAVVILTLQDCLKYALKNQPALNQAFIDEAIARTNNAIAFSPWLPQVSGAASYTHYLQLPTTFSVLNGTLTSFQSGVSNIAIPSVTATQTLFSTDVLLAGRAAKLNVLEARQNTTGVKIELVAGVSKAFYDLLLSIEQAGVYQEDSARLSKNLSDAYNRYKSGIVDKVDYKQATIALNNSRSQLKSAMEAIDAKYAVLTQLMGFPAEKQLSVHFDTARMMQEIYTDTLASLNFEKRIEYQLLQTTRKLQRETTMYYQLGFLPSVSAFYNYNYELESNEFSSLLNNAYPYSLFGLQLNIPLFTGFRRMENIHKSHLQETRIDWDEVNLKLAIYTQYRQAMASYKSNLYYLHSQGENVQMAREVYDIVKLQYREGVKAYLDVIIAESDLRTSEINYLNALFQLLESKIDLEKAMGDIPTDI